MAATGPDYHVSVTGSDDNDGSAEAPLETISAAADRAQPGDTVTVHEGTYRERVDPPRGGTSDEDRIIYRAAEGESVVVKGSEIVDGWAPAGDQVWTVSLSNDFFGDYNPFADRIRGDWFEGGDRDHHTGCVYIDGTALTEAASDDDLLADEASAPGWYAEVADEETTIWARFGRSDPADSLVEVTVRRAVFYPDEPGRDYLTVRGFTMRHAATQWAPPTVEQIGLVGTHWSKGWVIEDNVISHSRCTGLTLGKYGQGVDDIGATAERFNRMVREALANGWEKGSVGHHVVRNNVIHDCGQSGIVGSLGAAFSEVAENHISDINQERLLDGPERAGIKFHGPIDTVIRHNRIHHAHLGVWVDWMAQGTRVTGNLLYGNRANDLYVEVNHGPFLVDNNLMLSDTALLNRSQGGAYAHNLLAGDVERVVDGDRTTPYHEAHSTAIAGMSGFEGGDDRFYNNCFVGHTGLAPYDDDAGYPVWMDGNVFLGGAQPSSHEPDAVERPDADPDVRLADDGEAVRLDLEVEEWLGVETQLVTTERLGEARVPGVPYTAPDGSPVRLDADYFAEGRDASNPAPGPFAQPGELAPPLDVWPR